MHDDHTSHNHTGADATASSGVPHLTVDGFDKALEDAGDQPLLVDFYADWCGPCQLAAPVIEKLAVEYKGKAVLAKVDVDNNRELAQRYGVMSIPTVILFHNKNVKEKQVGYKGEQGYVDMLNKVLKA
jgi:thioredoxin 1